MQASGLFQRDREFRVLAGTVLKAVSRIEGKMNAEVRRNEPSVAGFV